ncbi:hypothetical protein BTVI_81671 [Pitangus sulphuratus]|nr:hypothetical protein BTVI_81678 [Pitangus sulphuratus]KAJ7402977.1 hypothetical protein BTVI_81671 [Pitangus sulphuratus]
MRSDGRTLKHKTFRLNMRNVFMLRVAENWKRLPREVVKSASLETFKTHLDALLCHLLEAGDNNEASDKSKEERLEKLNLDIFFLAHDRLVTFGILLDDKCCTDM